MPTMKEICNLGLGKIGASRVNNLTPPVSAIENKCASEYPQWKASELKKRRWVFATTYVRLNALPDQVPVPLDNRTYVFNTPGDMLRPIRPKNCPWVQRGQFFYSSSNIIDLEYIRNAADSELSDAMFVDVLAARVGFECAELVTQSPARKRDAYNYYKICIDEAGRSNAFVLDLDQTAGDDAAYTWDTARQQSFLSGY